MIAYFRDLHIVQNTNNLQENVNSTVHDLLKPNEENSNSLEGMGNFEYPRLILSDEVKKLKDEPILPSALLSKL